MERKRNITADPWDLEQCPLVLGLASADLALSPVVECREHKTKQTKQPPNRELSALKFKIFFLSLNGLAGAELGDLLLGGTLRYWTACSPSPDRGKRMALG